MIAFAAALGLAVTGACTEDLGTGAACPELCPAQDVEMLQTVIEPIQLDTTLIGIPPAGSAGRLLVASRGDSLVSYGVIRFDSLPTTFVPPDETEDVPIAEVREATLRVLADTMRRIVTAPITIELYDVDTTAADTNTAAIAALVRPDRLIGSLTLPADTAPDTLRIPVDEAALLERLTDERRLRIAIAISSAESAQLYLIGLITNGQASRLTFVPVSIEGVEGDTISVVPISTTPTESRFAATLLTDYTVTATPTPPPQATEFAVGGLPNRRAYLRFDVPAALIDSATIVRATLILTQQPVQGIDDDVPIGVYPYITTGGGVVTDVARAALLIAAGSAIGLDSLAVVPSDSGEVSLELGRLLRAWRGQDPEISPRALVLRTSAEGLLPVEIRFSSMEAAAGIRPRLVITYIPRADFGLP